MPDDNVMTYTSLLTDIRAYIERGGSQDETVFDQIPRIVANTQRTLADKLKILGYLGVYTSTMQAGQPVIAKPANWRSTTSITYGSGVELNEAVTLRARNYEYIKSIYPVSTDLGSPEFYADYNLQNWFVAPTPNQNFNYQAIVYRLPDLLSLSNEQNYLTQYAPFLLLYECLANMEAFLKFDSRITVWKGLAKEQFDAINLEDLHRMVDRGQVRDTT